MKQKVLISIPMQEYVSRGLLGGVEIREEIDLAIIEYTGKMGFLLDKKDNFDENTVEYIYEIWYEAES